MSTAKNKQVSRIKEKRTSTFAAKLDACSGTNGKGDCTALERSFGGRTWPGTDAGGVMIPPVENHKTNKQAQEGNDSAHANDRQDGGAVARFGGVVLVAEKKDVIEGAADFAGGGVDQSEAHVARRIFDAVEITRDAAVRGAQKNSTGGAGGAGFLVVAETKIRGLGDRVDGLRGTDKKMPAAFGERAGKAGHRFVIFLQRRVRG